MKDYKNIKKNEDSVIKWIDDLKNSYFNKDIITTLLQAYKYEIHNKTKCKTKKFFNGFEPVKMHCEFTYTTNYFKMNLEIYQTSFVMKEVL